MSTRRIIVLVPIAVLAGALWTLQQLAGGVCAVADALFTWSEPT